MRAIFVLLFFLATAMAGAADATAKVSTSEKILMQAAMQKEINSKLIDGKFLYFDKNKSEVITLFPAKPHPKILKMSDYYIVCADFRNTEGKPVIVDFFIARKDKEFVIFDILVDERAPIMSLMKAGKVRVVK